TRRIRTTDDRGDDAERALLDGRRSQTDLRAIEEDVIARPHFRDALLGPDEARGRRRADADLLDVDAGVLQSRRKTREHLDLARGDPFQRLVRFSVIPVSRVAQEA